MNTTEDRARAAMRAIAATIDDAPPLAAAPDAWQEPARLRERRARRWRGWAVPLTAAVAMLAVAVTLVIVRNIPNGRVAPATPAPSFAVPEYYVALSGTNAAGISSKVVVGETVSGKRLFTASGSFALVTAAADDRTFVVGAQGKNAFGPDIWYLIRVTAGPAPHVTMRRLPITIPRPSRGIAVIATALSPDGTKLATMNFGIGIRLQVYSLTTGELIRQWSTTRQESNAAEFPYSSGLWWTSDGQLAFPVERIPGQTQNRVSIRMLSVTSPGHDLFAASRVAASMRVKSSNPLEPTAISPFRCTFPGEFVTPDGKNVLCPATGVFRLPALPGNDALCPAIPAWNDEGFIEYSTVTGRLVRTLDIQKSSCFLSTFEPVQVLWASSGGNTIIGAFTFSRDGYRGSSVTRFGVLSGGEFRPLPAPPGLPPGPNAQSATVVY